MALTINEAASCSTCGEVVTPAEPCACVRGRPAPLTEEPLQACADSQHYACPGYGLQEAPGVSLWLRCNCTCHEESLVA